MLREQVAEHLIRERIVDEPNVCAAYLKVEPRVGLLSRVPVDDSIGSCVYGSMVDVRVELLANIAYESARAAVGQAIVVLRVQERKRGVQNRRGGDDEWMGLDRL